MTLNLKNLHFKVLKNGKVEHRMVYNFCQYSASKGSKMENWHMLPGVRGVPWDGEGGKHVPT